MQPRELSFQFAKPTFNANEIKQYGDPDDPVSNENKSPGSH